MTENATGLPPFSFKKKPVSQYSICPTGHSNITEVLPSATRPAYFGSDLAQDSSALTGAICPIFREVDYDQQIRAPRMSNPNYTHVKWRTEKSDSLSSLNKDSDSGPSSVIDDSLEHTPKSSNSQHNFKYEPAAFDLTKSTRRFSTAPSSQDTPEEATILDYTTDNHIYEKHSHRNLSSTNNDPCKSNELNQFGVKQVYEPKKPLFVPAVLRLEGVESEKLEEPDFNHAPTPNVCMPDAESLWNFASVCKGLNKLHWKPDSSTDHCMKCFKDLRTFFFSRNSRRHHCRYCGFILCADCLIDGEHDLVLLDNEARFVVPIYKNLSSGDYSQMFVKNFKTQKICKSCGANYFKFKNLLNARNLKLPYLFVENPYVSLAQQDSSEKTPSSADNIKVEDPVVVDSKYRRSSINNVPTDWVWSSF